MTEEEYEREIASDSICFSRTIELLRIIRKAKFNPEGLFDVLLGHLFFVPSVIYDCIVAPIELEKGRKLHYPW